MGRLLKRVPLNFNAPINKTWEGYVNPHYKKCPHCENGYTAARVRLNDLVRLIMLSGSDSIKGKNHPYFDNMKQCVNGFNSIPSKDMAELTAGLAGRSPDRPFGHDSSDSYNAARKIIKVAGLKKDWGICQACKGNAIDPQHKKAYNKWRSKEPPKGKGYQMWENTSEGSPQSPVFDSLEKLSEWCADNATVFGDDKVTKEEWFKMLGDNNVHLKKGNLIFV